MKIAIRVDTNEIIATGHVMRCLSIANALYKDGASPVFFSADDSIIPFLDDTGYEYHILGTRWDHLDDESGILTSLLHKLGISSILIDSYSVTPAYMQAIRDAGIYLAYIDDIDAFPYPADMLINYSPAYVTCSYGRYESAASHDHIASDNKELNACSSKIRPASLSSVIDGRPTYLLGPSYTPLREQFQPDNMRVPAESGSDAYDVPGTIAPDEMNSDCIHNIFITSGGSDSLGIITAVTSAILECPELSDVTIHHLAGRFFKITDVLDHYSNTLSQKGKPSYILHQNVSNVADIMRGCDAAVCPGATTLFELCSCAVPAISYSFADNQISDAVFFDRQGLIPYAGDYRENREVCIKNIVENLIKLNSMTQNERFKKGTTLQSLVDGRGAARIAGALIKYSRIYL